METFRMDQSLANEKVTPIDKSTFNYFVGFHKTQLTTLAQGLLDHEYMLWEKLAKFKGGGNLKSMLEFCQDCKKYAQICHKIMAFHWFLRLTLANPIPYLMNDQ